MYGQVLYTCRMATNTITIRRSPTLVKDIETVREFLEGERGECSTTDAIKAAVRFYAQSLREGDKPDEMRAELRWFRRDWIEGLKQSLGAHDNKDRGE